MSEYNIDRLRKPSEDQIYPDYYLATRKIVKGALETEHVTHLQRYARTVAMRHSVIDGETFYTLDFSNRTCQQFTCLNTAIDCIMEYLNQGEHAYDAGDCLSVFCNQASRSATVLAVLGREIMVEVEMPGTTSQCGYNRRTGGYRHEARPTSFLVRYEVGYGMRRNAKNYSYNSVPKSWLRAINIQSGDWIGMGQRMHEPLALPAA